MFSYNGASFDRNTFRPSWVMTATVDILGTIWKPTSLPRNVVASASRRARITWPSTSKRVSRTPTGVRRDVCMVTHLPGLGAGVIARRLCARTWLFSPLFDANALPRSGSAHLNWPFPSSSPSSKIVRQLCSDGQGPSTVSHPTQISVTPQAATRVEIRCDDAGGLFRHRSAAGPKVRRTRVRDALHLGRKWPKNPQHSVCHFRLTSRDHAGRDGDGALVRRGSLI